MTLLLTEDMAISSNGPGCCNRRHFLQLLTDKAMIQEKRKLAADSLEQLQAYTKVDTNSQDWQVSLKGSCT